MILQLTDQLIGGKLIDIILSNKLFYLFSSEKPRASSKWGFAAFLWFKYYE